MAFAYLLALGIALTGMVLLDRRFSLFFWACWWRAAIVLAVGVGFFLVWDITGIRLGLFFRGVTDFMTGWLVAPELPVEEVFFLTLLCYLTMNVYTFATSVLVGSMTSRTGARGGPRGRSSSYDGLGGGAT